MAFVPTKGYFNRSRWKLVWFKLSWFKLPEEATLVEHVEDVVLSLLNVVSAWISTELDPVLQRQLNLDVH